MIYFHHIPGTGGRSIVTSFLDYAGDSALIGALFPPGYRVTVNDKHFNWSATPPTDTFFGCSHTPIYECHNILPNAFRFTVLRDPITRFAGRYRQHHMALKLNLQTNWVGENILDCANKWLTTFSRKDLVLNQLWMFSETYNIAEVLTRLYDLGAILRCENMSEGMKDLTQKLQLDPPLRTFAVREHPASQRHTTPEELVEFYGQVMEQVQKYYDGLREIFDPEYQMMEALNV